MPTADGKDPRRLVIDLDQLESLSGLQCTQAEIASHFGCSLQTIKRRLRDEPAAREAYDRGRAKGQISLRRKMYKSAMEDSNVRMMIHLSKHWLGMRDDLTIRHGPEIDENEDYLDELKSKLAEMASRRASDPDTIH